MTPDGCDLRVYGCGACFRGKLPHTSIPESFTIRLPPKTSAETAADLDDDEAAVDAVIVLRGRRKRRTPAAAPQRRAGSDGGGGGGRSKRKRRADLLEDSD